ncbi:hypothetical protein Rsub_08969 [Raphidocelis subcapitata]|uniref:ZNF380 coiled-coil domain-containing protein n=1 Tax=Raphidocelis subcapitata TaxID=307507 RepID=A0A2V0PDX3_9CHLO|nr:hypothetical protein Rsub_08969 [Raphidocelis subcapitata]|eukprot:GBF96093.1 hypothetical protein Rsub_08969 [Raphidocelis subcapitata]
MSDFQAAFKAAQAQRGLASKPTAKQVKARKLAEQEAARTPKQPQQQQRPGAPAAGGARPAAQGLPADFFDGQPKAGTSAAAAKPPPRPAPAPAAPAAAAADAAAVPKGFFDDKTADAKARGVKIPDKADKEAAFAAFTTEITTALAEQADEEDEDAAEAAEARVEREAYEQRMRQERIERLKRMRAGAAAGAGGAPGPLGGGGGEEDEDAAGALGPGPVPRTMASAVAAGMPQAKRRRVLDALADVLDAGGSGSGEESGEGGEDDAVLDWRRKAV